MGVGGKRHDPATLPQERPGTHCIRDWVGPTAGLDRIRSPDRPARSDSLHGLRYPGPI
jgi:hypothetical protein